MRVRISAAARLAGVSKSTMHRALKTGRVSYETDEKGERWIDPSEVARVYADTAETGQPHEPRHAETRAPEPPVAREVDLLRELLEREREMVDDLRRRLDAAEAERRELNLRLLTDQRSWWRRWKGR